MKRLHKIIEEDNHYLHTACGIVIDRFKISLGNAHSRHYGNPAFHCKNCLRYKGTFI